MQIVINLDIEEIVTQEIRKYVRENLVIRNTSNTVGNPAAEPKPDHVGSIPVNIPEDNQDSEEQEESNDVTEDSSSGDTNSEKSGPDYEYAPQAGKRRNKEEMALHEAELKVQRRLTPEEKGKVRAEFEVSEEDEEKAKQAAKKQIENERTTQRVLDQVHKESLIDKEESTDEEPSEEDASPPFALSSEMPENDKDSGWELPDTPAENPKQADLFSSSSRKPTEAKKETEPDEPEKGQTPVADNLDSVHSLFS